MARYTDEQLATHVLVNTCKYKKYFFILAGVNIFVICFSVLGFYQDLNRAGWSIEILPFGWQFVHESFIDTRDMILLIPVPVPVQGLRVRRDLLPSPPMSPATSNEANSQWYIDPSPPPSPPPIRRIPELLFLQPQPLVNECGGCPVCLIEEVFPNVVFECGHCCCQTCVSSLEGIQRAGKCPMCRTICNYIVSRVPKK